MNFHSGETSYRTLPLISVLKMLLLWHNLFINSNAMNDIP